MADFDFTQLKGRMAQAGKGGHVELSDLERNALISNAMDGGGGSVDPEEVQELIDESLEGYYNKFEVDSELNTKSDKSDTYTKAQVDETLATLEGGTAKVVSSLPTASADTQGDIYYVTSSFGNSLMGYVTVMSGSSYQWANVINYNFSNVGNGYACKGVAMISTNPDTTASNVFYILGEVGTYPNMGSIVHTSGIGIALWNGTAWSYQNVPSSAVVPTDPTPTENSTNPVQSGGVYDSLIIKETEENLDLTDSGGYLRFVLKDATYPDGVLIPNYTGLSTEQIATLRSAYDNNIAAKKSLNVKYYAQSNSFHHAIAAVTPNDSIEITANANYPCFYVVLASNIDVSTNPQNFSTEYDSVVQINAGQTAQITIPSDGHYLYIYAGYVGEEHAEKIFLPSSVKKVVKQDLSDWSDEVEERLDTLEEEIPTDIEETVAAVLQQNAETVKERTIFEFNPDIEMKQKMVLLKKGYFVNASLTEATPMPLVFAHISDVHGDYRHYQRFCDFCEHWRDSESNDSLRRYIVDMLDSGDIVQSNYGQSMTNMYAVEGFGKILKAIGNHDTHSTDEETNLPTGQNAWQYHDALSLDTSKKADAYNKYLVGPDSSNPYISNWGVTQPTDAATNGLCYYYKDYTDNNVRLIVLDVMAYGETQAQWFSSILSSANTAGLHVVVMAHFPGELMDRVDCNYSSLFLTGDSYSTLDTYGTQYTRDSSNGIVKLVDDFQTNGGIFVGYIAGHYHRDMVNTIVGYPKQLVFAVSSGGKSPIRDFTKKNSSKSYDDFQLISINAYDKTVRLCKVGANIDYYMRKKGTICVGYTLVTDDGTEAVGETATKVRGIIGEGW